MSLNKNNSNLRKILFIFVCVTFINLSIVKRINGPKLDFFTSVAVLQYPASLAALTPYKASLKLIVCYSSVISHHHLVPKSLT